MAEVMVQVDEKQPVEIDPAYDAPVLVEYRPLSRWALISGLMIPLAALALISPLLWIMPLAVMLVAMIAVRQTTAGERPPLGRKIAILSLVVSMFLLGYAPAHYIAIRSAVCAQAKKFGDHWISLVRNGRLLEAHQLTMIYYDRVAAETDLEEHYEPRFPDKGVRMRLQMGVSDPRGELDSYFLTAPHRQMVNAGKKGKYEFVSAILLPDESKGPIELVELRYRFTYPDKGSDRTIPLRLRMKCMKIVGDKKHWNVDAVDNPDLPRPFPVMPGMNMGPTEPHDESHHEH